MPGRIGTERNRSRNRRAHRTGAALLASIILTGTAHAAGDRTLELYNMNTKESLAVTYVRGGRYDQKALDQLNWFLRDWRREEPIRMDPDLFDTVWEVYQRSGSREPIQVHSGYRSKGTNDMLRRRSHGVAEHSQHTLGKAMDFHLPDVPVSRLRTIALQMQDGGVGFYPNANFPFVHVDVGNVRHWPKLTREQLARVFPDGKTVHIPQDGKPMPRYEEARAEIDSEEAGAAARRDRKPNLLERLIAGLSGASAPQEVPMAAAPAPSPAAKAKGGLPAASAMVAALAGDSAAPPQPQAKAVPLVPEQAANPLEVKFPSRKPAPAAVAEVVPFPPKAPARDKADTRLASAERKEIATTSSSVRGQESMNALFASAAEAEGRKMPQSVLGYTALPLMAFMPQPFPIRLASASRPAPAQEKVVAFPKAAALPLATDIWHHGHPLPPVNAAGYAFAQPMGPTQSFTPTAGVTDPRPMRFERDDPMQGYRFGLFPPRRFALPEWLVGP